MSRRKRRVLAPALGLIASITLPASSRAGLLDFLFAPQRAAPSYVRLAPEPGDPEGFAVPTKRPRHHAKRSIVENPNRSDGAAKDGDAGASGLAKLVDSIGAQAVFERDPTLRPGDIVVTQAGLRVFEGGRGSAHTASQFRPLTQAALQKRPDLAQIERMLHGRTQFAAATPQKSPIRPLTIPRASASATAPDLENAKVAADTAPAIRKIDVFAEP